MANYMTGQRRELINFLESNPDRTFTAREIADAMAERGVSRSAVYRNLARLEENGEISRSVKGGSSENYYSYVASENCHNFLHLTCEKCGKTVHMNVDISEKMINDLNSFDGFSVDKKKTVLYGVCAECK